METPANPPEETPDTDAEFSEPEILPELHNLSEAVSPAAPAGLEDVPPVTESPLPEAEFNENPPNVRRRSWAVIVLGILLVGATISVVLLLARVQRMQTTIDSLKHALSLENPATDLRIISASYGSGGHFAEVSDHARDVLRHPDADFYAHPNWLGADPIPGWNKQLIVIYEFNGQRRLFTTGEGGRVSASLLRENAAP